MAKTEAEPIRLGRNKELLIEVFNIGHGPRALFMAGLHGHESGIISPLRRVLNRAMVNPQIMVNPKIAGPELLGRSVRVFRAYPPAIIKRTKEADDGVNLNRQFPIGEEITHPWAKLLTEALTKCSDVEYIFSFHEDDVGLPGFPFYFYDYPWSEEDDHSLVERLRDNLKGELLRKENQDLSGVWELGRKRLLPATS